jgi:Prenyltransferase and squalene oxidase repeat
MYDRSSDLTSFLSSCQLPSGGWSFAGSQQASTEATCLGCIALAGESRGSTRLATRFLLHSQRADGGSPAFDGDSEPSWTTALAVCTLTALNDQSPARERALHWLLASRGKEGHWFWRWKFKTADRNVRFDPDKYGWPWSPGAGSWVIPTAFSVIAIKQFTVCNRSEESDKRIQLGVEMLFDRACVGGGWNSGNSIVYGVPLRPHVEATAIALLSLQDEPRGEILQSSVRWLESQAHEIEAVSSLSWCILTLFVYQRRIEELKRRLGVMVGDGSAIRNNATLATALLALRCGEMIHPFMVLR